MEINTQQLESLFHLQEQPQLPRNKGTEDKGFQNVLNQQLDSSANPAATQAGSAQSALLSQLMLNKTENSSMDTDTAVLQAAFEEASGALDLWDTYAQTLGRSNTDTALKDAYSLLEGIDTRLSRIKSSPAAGTNAILDGILNELEILSTTEKFKFNRGDYLG